MKSNKLSPTESEELISLLKARFESNMSRHPELNWTEIESKLKANPAKLWSLNEMEVTGGEPDVIGFSAETASFLFCDCSIESPKGRRSICYDKKALDARKENKPKDSAVNMAEEMGIELLSEIQYRELQQLGPFDMKTSSWLSTPTDIRQLGGAIFGDWRYGTVFIYHNGAESYYAARSFRGLLKV